MSRIYIVAIGPWAEAVAGPEGRAGKLLLRRDALWRSVSGSGPGSVRDRWRRDPGLTDCVRCGGLRVGPGGSAKPSDTRAFTA